MGNRERNRRKRGCPTKEKAKLSTSINLKLTEADFNKIREKAGKLGMKATQYVREMVLKGSVKSRFTLEELDLMRKLAGIANNLNQVAKKANQAGYIMEAIEIMKIMNQIKSILNDR